MHCSVRLFVPQPNWWLAFELLACLELYRLFSRLWTFLIFRYLLTCFCICDTCYSPAGTIRIVKNPTRFRSLCREQIFLVGPHERELTAYSFIMPDNCCYGIVLFLASGLLFVSKIFPHCCDKSCRRSSGFVNSRTNTQMV